MIERIDHAVIAVASAAEAAEPFHRLGLRVGEPRRHLPTGSESRLIFVGESASQSFYLELFGIFDPDAARASGRTVYLDSIARGGGLTRLMLKVQGLTTMVDDLRREGVNTNIEEVVMGGRKTSDIAILGADPEMAIDAGLFESTMSSEMAFERREADGLFVHEFPLKRVDHFAALTNDMEASTRFWSEALGVPVQQEFRPGSWVIRHLKVGNSYLRLAACDGLQLKPGLKSFVAFEVPDLTEAVHMARDRGFTPDEPAAGIVPGSFVSTIPAAELSGVDLQLVAYV
jgi:catechol 2,3-dioxygenase-like lactoylglutathione lyase family enzyme